MAFYVTTNADLQNYETRIPAIKQYFSPAVEIAIFPENLPFKVGFDSKTCPRPHAEYSRMDGRLASDLGKVMKQSGIEIAQVHAPTGIRLGNANELLFKTLFGFCRTLRDASGLRQLSFNSHGFWMDIDSVDGDTYAEKRVNMHKRLGDAAKLAYRINLDDRSPCNPLLAENNGIGEDNEPPERCDPSMLKVTDLLPEDMMGRRFIDGVNFDFSHGWRVTECYRTGVIYPNLQWCRQDYEQRCGNLPPSATDFGTFIRTIAPSSRWVHVAGEKNVMSHKRLHLNDGGNAIDFSRYVSIFKEHADCDADIGVTIETIDSPSQDGFERMTGYYSWLNWLFNGSGS